MEGKQTDHHKLFHVFYRNNIKYHSPNFPQQSQSCVVLITRTNGTENSGRPGIKNRENKDLRGHYNCSRKISFVFPPKSLSIFINGVMDAFSIQMINAVSSPIFL